MSLGRSVILLLVWVAGWGADAPALVPPFQRVDLAPDAVESITYALRTEPGTRVTSVAVDCACLKLETPLPATVPPTGSVDLRFRVTGLRPGVEDVVVATSSGTARAQLQIVGPGAGRGREGLVLALATARREGLAVWAVVHDLRGQVRQCGCSLGALGGAGRLAALPALAATLADGVPLHWILTGDSDGLRPGVGTALATHGWARGAPEIAVSAEPLPLLTRPGLIAVIPTTPIATQHQRLLRPVLDGGLAVELLLVDATGRLRERHTMPVDDSLPDDPALTARFRDQLTSTIELTSNPAQSCLTCHATAGALWATSRHAHALDSLKPADRTDGCISCHVTPVAPAVVAPGVSCQACHQGGEAHAASAGKLRTTGTTDCRSCHDAKHHPTFRHDVAWPKIQHGREPAVGR
jgi:hypothetical protein